MEDKENLLIEENYYDLLNVSKTATNEEIVSAYRKFSKIFHPDKHSREQQESAQEIFNKVKEAYDVLSDSRKRAIYDTVGKRGLEVNGWEIIYRSRTPKEIYEEYERLKREKEENILNQTVNPKGTITVAINATELFSTYNDKYDVLEQSNIPHIEVSSMNIYQSINVPMTTTDTVTLSGYITTQNGIGSGSIGLSNKHYSSDALWTDYEFGIGNGSLFGFKIYRKISNLMFLNCAVNTHFSPRGMEPNFVSTVSMPFDSKSVGHITYKANLEGSLMSTSYVWSSQKVHTSSAIQIGCPHSFVSFNIMYKMPEREINFRLLLKYGTFGILSEYGVEKQVSKFSRVSAAVLVGVPLGVMLKLKWTYCSQTFVLPVHLCDEVMVSPVYYASVIPLISWLLVKSLILDPIAKDTLAKKRQRIMEANLKRIEELKSEAKTAVELMRTASERVVNEEKKVNGLIIMLALYGPLQEGECHHKLPPEPDVIDVTIPLQSLVRDSRLELLATTKADLPGFFDTHIGETKHLTVKYSFRNTEHIYTVADDKPLLLPHHE